MKTRLFLSALALLLFLTLQASAGAPPTKDVPGQLSISPPSGPSGYRVESFTSFSNNVAVGGRFTAAIPTDRSFVLWAHRNAQDPAFLAVVQPTDSTAIINARSTAIALSLLSPLLWKSDPIESAKVIDRLIALPELKALEQIIQAATARGSDYLEDGRFLSTAANVIQALLRQPPRAPALADLQTQDLAFSPNTPFNTRLLYMNPLADGIRPPARLKTTILPPNADYPDDYRIKLGTGPEGNRLDWFLELYELDPKALPQGFDSLLDLDHFSRPLRTTLDPLDTGVSRASLLGKPINLLESAVNGVTDYFFKPGKVIRAIDEFPVPKARPAAYVVQAYSGNPWFGTRFFFQPPISQVDTIDFLNAETQVGGALGANILVSAVDMMGAFVPTEALVDDPVRYQKAAYSIGRSILKTATIHPELNSDAIVDLLKKAVTSAVQELYKWVSDKKDNPLGLRESISKKLTTIAKVFDVLGKVSSALQSLERFSGYSAPYALAMERSIVVIGNPFNPVINAFHPQQGRGNDVISISGFNFPEEPSKVRVSFCTFASTADPTTPTLKLNVPVVAARPQTLLAIVPTNASVLFPNGKAFICVEFLTNNSPPTTTIDLAEPFREFRFIQPPKLLALEPNPVRPGGRLLLQGTNFMANAAENHEIIIDNNPAIRASQASDDAVSVTLPISISEGAHTLKLRLKGALTDALPFQVAQPASTSSGFKDGLGITITKLDLSNVADAQISLLEAILIANGTLGREIEQHRPCEDLPVSDPGACARVPRETDFVSGDQQGATGGPKSRDSIQLAAGLINKTLALTSPLPAPTEGDTYSLPLVLDLSALPAGTPGWDWNGTKGAKLNGLVLSNSPGNGLVLRGGARNNQIAGLTLHTPKLNGIEFLDVATDNEITSLRIFGAGKDGIAIASPGVRRNFITFLPGDAQKIAGANAGHQGYGIRIENGATYNNILPTGTISNKLGGILISGLGTAHNLIGRDEGSVPRLYEIAHNFGPGVMVRNGAQFNVLRYLMVSGNQGDGILLEGADCAFNQVDGVYVGYDVPNFGGGTAALPNQGNGIHLRQGAHNNLIGSHIPGSFGGRGSIVGNRDDGILIDGQGTDQNIVARKHIGQTLGFPERFIPNGKNGIRIKGGSKGNILGAAHSFLDLHIMASKEAGILIEGVGTENNVVLGNQIGTSHQDFSVPIEGHNHIGIHLRDRAKGNVIGQPGEFIQFFLGNESFVFRFANAICNSLDAAIVLENCGGTLGPQGVPVQPNVVQNNKIGEEDFAAAAPNQLGIRLQGQSELNVIGGPAIALGNRVYYNFDVGIQFSNVISSSLEHRNRVENNRVTQTGKVRQINIGGPPLPPPPSRLGYGIQIVDAPDARSYPQQVGEDGFSANTLDLNQIGVMVHNGAQRHLVSFNILNNFIAGVVLSNVTESAIGSDGFRQGNRIELNGRGNLGEGGIILSGGASNRIQGNRIGHLNAGNQGPGILIHNSHRNLIGGGPRLTGNQILANTSHGIHLSGPETLFTFVQNNLIGIAPDRSPAPNLADGIFISGGASKNLIGGETFVPPDGPGATLVQVPNDIAYNSGAGVRVDGPASLANSILYNSITKHPGKGIILSNGGNHEEPPPLWVSLVGGEVFGKALNPLVHPPGTLIQIFSDDDPLFPEGDEWLGDAVVDLNGNWSAPLTKPINHPLLSMTATRAGDLSTSEFGNRVIITNSELSRLEVTTNMSQSAVVAAPGANQVPLFKLKLSTLNLDYAVDHITLEAIGSLQDAASIHSVWVFDDANRNNQIDESDLLLGLRTGWPSNDGVAKIDLVGAKIPADSQRFWIVAVSLNGSAVAGQKLSFRIRSPQDWGARYILPFGAPTQVVGVHPLNSATLTVGTATPQSYASWRSSAFTPSQLLDPTISGPNADPDGDGLCNLQEYAFNLNPRVADSQRLEENGSKGSPRPGSVLLFEPAQNGGAEFLTVTFLRRKAPSDLSYAVDWSPDLAQWLGSQAQPEPLTLLDQRDVPGLISMEQVSYRTTAPMSGIAPAPKQFLRVAVSLSTP